MSVEMRPAMPAALPRAAAFRASQDRWLRWCATAVTVLAAVIGVVIVALAAVAIGIT